MWVYIQSERTGKNNCIRNLWTVGHYSPAGKWEPESDWGTPEEAAARCHYLNGGGADPEMVEALAGLLAPGIGTYADGEGFAELLRSEDAETVAAIGAAKAALSKAQKVRK